MRLLKGGAASLRGEALHDSSKRLLLEEFGMGPDPREIHHTTRTVGVVNAIDEKEISAYVAFAVVRPSALNGWCLHAGPKLPA